MKEHKYFVSYVQKNIIGNIRFGSCEVGISKEIASYEDIRDIAKKIEKKSEGKDTIILNYKKLY